jgi:hypothetical protein
MDEPCALPASKMMEEIPNLFTCNFSHYQIKCRLIEFNILNNNFKFNPHVGTQKFFWELANFTEKQNKQFTNNQAENTTTL